MPDSYPRHRNRSLRAQSSSLHPRGKTSSTTPRYTQGAKTTSAKQKQAYLLLNVIERIRRVNGEADQDDVRVGVTEGSESVVILLSGGIPQRQLDVLAINLDVGDIVLKDSGDVDLAAGSR